MSHVHEAMDHTLVARNRCRDARLPQPLPVFFSSISQWITLGSDDECWRQSLQVWSQSGGGVGMQLLCLLSVEIPFLSCKGSESQLLMLVSP